MAARVLPDANVLYSRTLRDWIIMLSQDDGENSMLVFWTEDIYAEVVANRRKRNPSLSGGAISRMREQFAGAMSGGRVDDYDVSAAYEFADPKDRHIDAAARACRAWYVVTLDSGFFSEEVQRDDLPYEVLTPDDYLMLVNEYLPRRVIDVTRRQADYWRRIVAGWFSGLCQDGARKLLATPSQRWHAGATGPGSRMGSPAYAAMNASCSAAPVRTRPVASASSACSRPSCTFRRDNGRRCVTPFG